MSMKAPSPEQVQLIRQGPFPAQIDPWAEQGRYFHQIHAHMIGYLVDQITEPLYERGYLTGRETSIQISVSQPDVMIEEVREHPRKILNYAEAGTILVQPEPDLDSLFIKALDTGQLVTVVEIVSPSNKASHQKIYNYQVRRTSLIQQGVNVVEIDLTRSVKRLLDDNITESFPYHIVIYPHDEPPHFLGMRLEDAPKTFALPLRDDVIATELNPIYRLAYSKLLVALQIHNAGDYTEAGLPFPSLLTEAERQALLERVRRWQQAVQQ